MAGKTRSGGFGTGHDDDDRSGVADSLWRRVLAGRFSVMEVKKAVPGAATESSRRGGPLTKKLGHG